MIGLFTGMSVLSLVEMLFWIYRLVINYINTCRGCCQPVRSEIKEESCTNKETNADSRTEADKTTEKNNQDGEEAIDPDDAQELVLEDV